MFLNNDFVLLGLRYADSIMNARLRNTKVMVGRDALLHSLRLCDSRLAEVITNQTCVNLNKLVHCILESYAQGCLKVNLECNL